MTGYASLSPSNLWTEEHYIQRLSHPDSAVRAAAADYLIHDHPGLRAEVAQTLAAIGSDSDSLVSALETLLMDDDVKLRYSAAVALGDLGPVARSAEPALRAALNDEAARVRDAAAEALTRIRNGTRPDLTE